METALLPSGRRLVLYEADEPHPAPASTAPPQPAEPSPVPTPTPTPTPTPEPGYLPAGEVWIAPAGASTQPGRGSPEDPLRLKGPGALDPVLATYREGGRIHLYPGEYSTRGSWAATAQMSYRALRSGAILGAGSKRTRILLEDPVDETTPGSPRTDLNLIWLTGDHCHVEGVTFDGRADAFPGHTVGGLYIWGGHAVVKDVRVQGLRGEYTTHIEVFGIGTNALNTGGTRIEDCEVHGAPGTYVSAFSVGYRPDRTHPNTPIRPSYVTRCHAVGELCHFAFGACHATTFRDCSSEGFKYGFYNDTDQARDVLLHGCRFEPTYSGIHLVLQHPHPTLNPGWKASEWTKSRIRVEACSFEYRDPGTGKPFIGLGLIDTVKDPAVTPFSDIQVSRCRFGVPRLPFCAYSTDAASPPGVILTENTFPFGTTRNGAGPVLSRSVHADGTIATVGMYSVATA